MIIVVDEMERIAPRKSRSMNFQPRRKPVRNPRPFIIVIPTNAVMKAEPPTLKSFRKLNSSPSEKSRKITPISD
jgi:hypothetical protein